MAKRPEKKPSYNYQALAKELIRQFNRPIARRVGLGSWQLMYALDIKSVTTFRIVKKIANDLLRDSGQMIQYNPNFKTYFLVSNGQAAIGLRTSNRYIVSRILTWRNDVIAVRNGYPKGSVEWERHDFAAKLIRQAKEVIEALPEA